jgi:drug/metabolite transporter, DME family
VFVAVLFWSASASFAKYLFSAKFDALIITQTRVSISFLLLSAFFLFRNRSVFRIQARDLPLFVALGIVGMAATTYTYYFTVQESTVATAIVLQYTAPVIVMIYSVAILKEESAHGIKILSLVLSVVGCFLAVSGGSWERIQLRGWAVISGPASALSYAAMLIMSKRIIRSYSVWTMLSYGLGIASLFWLFINPPWTLASAGYSGNDWGIFFIFAVVSILIPYSAFVNGLQYLEASTVGIASTLEPVLAIAIAAVVLGETLDTVQTSGAFAVVVAVAMLQIPARRALAFLRRRR